MDLFALTRRLIDIESITPNEVRWEIFFLTNCGVAVLKPTECRLKARARTCSQHGRGMIIRRSFSPLTWIQCRRLSRRPKMMTRIYGRGACDAKGIIAAQVLAAEKLRATGVFVGLLFLVGEERDSIGGKIANQHPIGSRFMINGEPTENKLALASKGALHVEIVARGKMAHSAYPELGESAIDKLVEALHQLHAMELPRPRCRCLH